MKPVSNCASRPHVRPFPRPRPRRVSSPRALACGAAAACALAFALAGCASAVDACELDVYAEASDEGDARASSRMVAACVGGGGVDDTMHMTLQLNAGVTESSTCTEVVYRPSDPAIKIALSPGLWADEVTLPYAEADRKGFLYLDVPVTGADADAWTADAFEALGADALLVTYRHGEAEETFAYRIEPTERLLERERSKGAAPDDASDAESSVDAPLFLIEKTPA